VTCVGVGEDRAMEEGSLDEWRVWFAPECSEDEVQAAVAGVVFVRGGGGGGGESRQLASEGPPAATAAAGSSDEGGDSVVEEESYAGCGCVRECVGDSCPCLAAAAAAAATGESRDLGVSLFECGPACACCHRPCGNRRTQHACAQAQLAVGVEIFPTPAKGGWGLRAKEGLRKGDVIVEYVGEVVGREEVERRRRQQEREGRQNYLIVLCEIISSEETGGKRLHTCVDASRRGNAARFANHSCDPNMLPVPVRTGRRTPRIVFFAARAIAAGEELTISYGSGGCGEGLAANRGSDEPAPRKPCLCGAVTCRGVLPFDDD
jgi:histone-lysine N-methyltransferase SETMAR